MSFEEFQERMAEVVKARRIFIPHITPNITTAFELYQAIFAKEEMKVFISTREGGNKSMSPLDDLLRPHCEECDAELGLRINAIDTDGRVHATSWVCEKCGREEYSDKSVQDWMEVLSEAGKQNDQTEE